MDKKSLKRIKRKELLEIMLEQAKRIKELEDKLALYDNRFLNFVNFICQFFFLRVKFFLK